MKKLSQVFIVLVIFQALISVSLCEDIYTKHYQKAQQIVSKMTLEQKLGQMTQPELSSLSSNNVTNFQKIKELGLGSVLVGGNGAPTDDGNLQTGNLNYHLATRENWKKLGDRLMEETVIEIALDEQKQEVAKIQLLLGTDAVHGNQHVIGEVLFPHNIGLAATYNPEHFYLQGQITANNTLASGWNYLFAPTVAVSHNAQWGRYYETLGQNHDMIKKYAKEFVNGAQQVDQDGVIRGAMTSTKHFLGDGATYEGRDEGNDKIYNFTAFIEHNIQGYRGGIEAQTGTIMCSYSAINSIPMAINADLLQNVLKEKEGFTGFIISDYNQRTGVAFQGQPTSNIKMTEQESTCLIINAGMDMMMMGGGAEDYIKDLKKCVESGEVAMDRIDDAVKRILAVKMAMGIVQIVNNTSIQIQKLEQQLPVDPQFVAQSALQAAKESLVLLKNDNDLLPINLTQIEYVILIGERDIQERENYQVVDEYVIQDTNNIGAQNGGWSVHWQGYEGNEFWSGDYKNQTSAFSIFDSLVNRLGKDRILKPNYSDIRNYTSIRYERQAFIEKLKSLNLTSQNTLIIGALTESPYAEFMGEINNSYCQGHKLPPVEGCIYINGHANPYMPYLQKSTLEISYDNFSNQVLSSVSSDIPLITVLITGRPMIINDEISRSTSFIQAWLPGTTGGEAIVQAIFGEYLFGQNGYSNRLPIDWVQKMEDLQQFPIYNQKGDIPKIQNPLFQIGFGLYTQNSKIEKNIQ